MKRKRGKEYNQYLVKNSGYSNVYAMWMMEENIKKKGTTLLELISSGLEINFPKVHGVGAPT